MAWSGGFSGVGFTREEFKKWLSTQKRPPYHRIVNHMTDAPYTKASVGCVQRIKNLGNYYKNDLKWSGGPDFFILGDGKVYLGSPLGKSIGCKGWNGNSFHIETEGKYDGKTHDYKTGSGLENWKVAAWVQAELVEWMGWNVDSDRIKLHKEGATSHACPGVVPKAWIIERINEARGKLSSTDKLGVKPVAPAPKPSAQLFDILEIQTQLKRVGIDPGPLDGVVGPKTLAAIGKWQERLTIEATGLLGPWAWDRLKREPSAVSEALKPAEQTMNLKDMHISKKGRELIEHFEGCPTDKKTGLAVPYDDIGALAICYGHSNRSNKPPVVTPDLRLTMDECDKILAQDLIDYENYVKDMVKVPLTQARFDSLTSLCYNWGPGNLKRSKIITAVNAGNHKEAEAQIRLALPPKDKKHYAGILRRRNKEADLYAS